MQPCLAAILSLLLTASVCAESVPPHPADPPRFGAEWRVRWSDGSIGRIVGQARWEPSNTSGQWFYTVQFGGPDSLYWSLPEQGLELAEDE